MITSTLGGNQIGTTFWMKEKKRVESKIALQYIDSSLGDGRLVRSPKGIESQTK